MKTKQWITGLVMGGSLAYAAAAAAAPAGEFTIEGFGGYYDPDTSNDTSEIYGGRLGLRPSEKFGMVLSLGVIDLEDQLLGIEDRNLRWQLFLADYSFAWYPAGSGFYLMAGPGYSRIDLEVDVAGENNDRTEHDNAFTIHAGAGYRWDIGQSFFLRPEAKARWFEGTDFDAGESASWKGLDVEYSIGLGFRFGRN